MTNTAYDALEAITIPRAVLNSIVERVIIAAVHKGQKYDYMPSRHLVGQEVERFSILLNEFLKDAETASYILPWRSYNMSGHDDILRGYKAETPFGTSYIIDYNDGFMMPIITLHYEGRDLGRHRHVVAAQEFAQQDFERRKTALTPEWLSEAKRWNLSTFEGQTVTGVIDHIRKEIAELEANPQDPVEWADLILLALSGLYRLGLTGDEIIKTITDKQEINFNRQWSKQADPNAAVEHVREVKP